MQETKCSVRLAAVKMFVCHHHSTPLGLTVLFWRPSQKVHMSQLYAKKKWGLYLVFEMLHLE